MQIYRYNLPRRTFVLALALLGACLPFIARAQATFQGIGFTSFISGLSPSGDAFTGVYYPAESNHNTTAFAWTQSAGLIKMGLFPGSSLLSNDGYSYGMDITNGASTVVGYGRTSSAMAERAFKWTPSGGYELLPTPAGFQTASASAVSADGTQIFGRSFGTSPAFHYEGTAWTSSGARLLGTSNGSSWVNDSSADGSILVGRDSNAVYWNSSGIHSIAGWSADAVSSDGKFLVGTTTGSSGSKAFRYNVTTGIYDTLPLLSSDDTFATATDISGDGSIVVGSSGTTPFIWDAQNGIRSLESVLTGYGLTPSSWGSFSNGSLFISDDGKVIAGNGISLEHGNEVFLARFPLSVSTPVPEPETYGIFAGVFLIAAVIARRRFRR